MYRHNLSSIILEQSIMNYNRRLTLFSKFIASIFFIYNTFMKSIPEYSKFVLKPRPKSTLILRKSEMEWMSISDVFDVSVSWNRTALGKRNLDFEQIFSMRLSTNETTHSDSDAYGQVRPNLSQPNAKKKKSKKSKTTKFFSLLIFNT